MSRTVLLHPLGTDSRCWDDVRLGAGSFAIDLPGHGGAPALPRGADVADFAAVVADALDGERVHVVGASLGGLVAQHLAAEYPGLVDRLVLVDTVTVYPGQMRRMWRERAAMARDRGLAELADPMAAMWFTAPFAAGPVAARIREWFLAMDPESYARACEALATADTTGAVIAAPTLVVCGSADLPPFTDGARLLHERIAGAELAWLDGKHAAFLERAAAFGAELRRFLALDS
ncbi:alpha/beta fold hydrolase [Saccharomonospora sp. NPDC046836]|uniref:alpha/beta fold hydrolase n=1 Tax=Saccharomonospora sp. NPDC046836 TaxID=3156921 RepID=UPI0033F04EF3